MYIGLFDSSCTFPQQSVHGVLIYNGFFRARIACILWGQPRRRAGFPVHLEPVNRGVKILVAAPRQCDQHASGHDDLKVGGMVH